MRGVQHILVVDDDAGIRDTLAELLELEGFQVSSASDGLEALHRLQERRPDVIVVDRFMPRLDGVEFVARLRSDAATSDIPVVLMSGTCPAPGEPLAQVDALLAKPFDLAALLETVRRLGARG